MTEPAIPGLDDLDIRILALLQRDATLTHGEIAEQVASSKAVVWRRIRRMLDEGIIRHRVAVLDHRKIGLRVMVIAQVKLARHASDAVPRFVEAVRMLPQVIECHTLMGSVDFQLKIVVPSIEDYEHFVWQKLSQIEGVQEVNSVISMSQNVNTTELPLPGVERRPQRKVPPRRVRSR